MNRRPAPAAATWLLKLFCSSVEFEAVTGDLLEQYHLGRSRLWYVRQVLGIVVFGLYRKLREQGSALVLLLSIVFATAICTWTVLMILDIGGVFATILQSDDQVTRNANWFGLGFFILEIGIAVLYFRADRRKRKSATRRYPGSTG